MTNISNFILLIFVIPEYMRHSLEKMIIQNNDYVLQWNKHKK